MNSAYGAINSNHIEFNFSRFPSSGSSLSFLFDPSMT